MIDKKRLIDEIGLDEKFCTEILNLFFKQFQPRLNTITIAYRTKNNTLLKEELHQLLGSASYCRFNSLQNAIIDFQQSQSESQEKQDEKFRAFLDISQQLINEYDEL